MENEKLIISGTPIDVDRDFLKVTETSYGAYNLLIHDKNGKTKFNIKGEPKRILKLVLAIMEIWSEDKCYEEVE